MFAGRRFAVLLTLSITAALALAGLAVAYGRPASAESAVAAASTSAGLHRNVVWYGLPEASPRTLHIESTSMNTPLQDEFQITYSGGNFTLVYQRVAGGPITTQYTMAVAGLIEWNDTSGDGQFGDGAAIVAYTPLGPGAFGRFAVQHNETMAPGGVSVNTFLIESNKGDATLNLTIADGFVRLPSGQNLTPMEAKLTLEVNHTMTEVGTRLSLQLAISTDQKVQLQNQSWDDQYEFSTDDRAVNVTNDGGPAASSAFFAWSNSASVNGANGTVIPSGPNANETVPGSYDLYLTYPQQAPGTMLVHVVHDPTIGVVSAAYLSSLHPGPGSPLPFEGDAIVYAVSLAGIALLVAGTVIMVGRRRRKGP
jgi:hypothetical protein